MSIEIKNVSVTYKNGVKALNQVNLCIEKGIYGLLGENGAGKTTLMRVLTTIIKPDEGTISLNGIPYTAENVHDIKKKIGYLPQEINIYPELTIRESLMYLGQLSGVSKEECNDKIDYYLEKTSLTEHQKKKNRQLSGGMKRRVGLIQALLHDPEFLIIDEPTTGLDPEERIRIRNLLVDFAEDRTILFSTHVVEDLATTCNQLAIMKKGQFLYQGNRKELMMLAKEHVWNCTLKAEEDYHEIEKRCLISARQYAEEGMKIKLISQEKPEFSDIEQKRIECNPADVSLEDAYMYVMNFTK